MRLIRVPDIGDGLSAALYTRTHKRIQIDCGSQQKPKEAYQKGMLLSQPNYFILSHFHADHYNGLFEGIRQNDKYDVKEVIMPILPLFTQRTEYLKCLFAMNIRVLGKNSGSMDFDFLHVMNKLSNQGIKHKRVKSGDEIILGGTHLQILWPPEVIKEEDILASVQKALEKFNEAKQKDTVLQDIYNSLEDKKIFDPYLNDEVPEILAANDIPSDQAIKNEKREKIPEITNEANAELRKVANRLSLGFRSDSELLFLGDLESHEINKVVCELERETRLHFDILMTPHHGTHWGKEMQKLNIKVAISSVGKKLFWHTKPNYKEIAHLHLITHFQGDIIFPKRSYLIYDVPWWF